MANQPYLHIGIATNMVCKGAYCTIKADCNRHKFYHNAVKYKLLSGVLYLSGIPTGNDGKSCYFKDRQGAMNPKPLKGHSVKRWPAIHPGRRNVSCLISEEQYRKLEDMRDALNNGVCPEDEDGYYSVAQIASWAIDELIEKWDNGFE